VQAATDVGRLDVRADLVVGADGRHSLVRAKAGLPAEELGAAMDVAVRRLVGLGIRPEHVNAPPARSLRPRPPRNGVHSR